MNLFNKSKKGQSLPLNAIVIAILVVVVLLVIILFFTGSFGQSQGQVNTIQGCNANNPVLGGWTNIQEASVPTEDRVCPGGLERIAIIQASQPNSDGRVTICCGTRQ